MKGPAKFSPKAEERAIKAAQEQIDLAKSLVKWLHKHDFWQTIVERAPGTISLGEMKELKLSKLSNEIRERFESGFVEDLEAIAKINARRAVKKFIDRYLSSRALQRGQCCYSQGCRPRRGWCWLWIWRARHGFHGQRCRAASY